MKTLEQLSDREMDALCAEKVMHIPKEKWPLQCVVNRHRTDDEIFCYVCNIAVEDSEKVPDWYSSDIAAAYEMEEEIFRQGKAVDYGMHLGKICEDDCKEAGLRVSFTWLVAHASPKQRALAALRTFKIALEKTP
jgi:hypothetical protein